MLYQIKVSEKIDSKKIVKLSLKPVLLYPRLTIAEAAYWQKRAEVLLPGFIVDMQVAKETASTLKFIKELGFS
jgi:hypothetical protein